MEPTVALAGGATAWVAVLGVVSFAAMVHDKRAAGRRARRTPERRLLLFAFAGGAFGVWAGMSVARHKTRHLRFRVLVPLAAAGWSALVVALWLSR